MGEIYEIALYVSLIGMTTVFTILLLVVLSSNLMIRLLNKYGPEPVEKDSTTKVDPKTIAILTAVVNKLTSGKGQIKTINKS